MMVAGWPIRLAEHHVTSLKFVQEIFTVSIYSSDSAGYPSLLAPDLLPLNLLKMVLPPGPNDNKPSYKVGKFYFSIIFLKNKGFLQIVYYVFCFSYILKKLKFSFK